MTNEIDDNIAGGERGAGAGEGVPGKSVQGGAPGAVRGQTSQEYTDISFAIVYIFRMIRMFFEDIFYDNCPYKYMAKIHLGL